MRAVVGLAFDGPGVVERLVVQVAFVVPEALLVVVQPVVDHLGQILNIQVTLLVEEDDFLLCFVS